MRTYLSGVLVASFLWTCVGRVLVGADAAQTDVLLVDAKVRQAMQDRDYPAATQGDRRSGPGGAPPAII